MPRLRPERSLASLFFFPGGGGSNKPAPPPPQAAAAGKVGVGEEALFVPRRGSPNRRCLLLAPACGFDGASFLPGRPGREEAPGNPSPLGVGRVPSPEGGRAGRFPSGSFRHGHASLPLPLPPDFSRDRLSLAQGRPCPRLPSSQPTTSRSAASNSPGGGSSTGRPAWVGREAGGDLCPHPPDFALSSSPGARGRGCVWFLLWSVTDLLGWRWQDWLGRGGVGEKRHISVFKSNYLPPHTHTPQEDPSPGLANAFPALPA